VVLENYLHFIAQSSDLNKSISSFKSYTARKIIDCLEARGVERLSLAPALCLLEALIDFRD
jgi:hypothetical protein